MTYEEFIAIVKNPESVKSANLSDYKELINLYPYFVAPHLFLIKSLQETNSIHFAANLKIVSLYSTNRSWLYYYLYPEKKQSLEPLKRERVAKSSGDYFDMINAVELQGGDTKQSLKNLAERLKSARKMVVNSSEGQEPKQKNAIIESLVSISESEVKSITEVDENIESEVKKLISERKYEKAIEILKGLNLNNPKKSVYFADQIRFLEKVIANSKK
ncbi:MAG: hypothetical protein P4L34_03040 [Paludibacter sp.]|nr:hypothetical protein [Paludibacter sp.]